MSVWPTQMKIDNISKALLLRLIFYPNSVHLRHNHRKHSWIFRYTMFQHWSHQQCQLPFPSVPRYPALPPDPKATILTDIFFKFVGWSLRLTQFNVVESLIWIISLSFHSTIHLPEFSWFLSPTTSYLSFSLALLLSFLYSLYSGSRMSWKYSP